MKPVLFIDFDGTLCHDKFWRSLPAEKLAKIKIFEFDDEHIAQRWMRGEFTSEEINQRIAEVLGMEYEELWEVFVNNCRTMTVSPETLHTLSDLRGAFHVVLMTDNMDSFDRFTVPSLQLDHYFDLIVNSYNEKIGKDDDKGKSFITVMEKLHSTIDGSILIDNSKSTCEIFTNLGGESYLVSAAETLTYWLNEKIKTKLG